MTDERSVHDDTRTKLHAPAHLLPGDYVVTQDGTYYPVVHDPGTGRTHVHMRHFHVHEGVSRHRCAHPPVFVAPEVVAPEPVSADKPVVFKDKA